MKTDASSNSLKMKSSSRPLLDVKQEHRSVEVQTDHVYLIASPSNLRYTFER